MPGSSARPRQASLSSSIVHRGGKRRGVGMRANEKPDDCANEPPDKHVEPSMFQRAAAASLFEVPRPVPTIGSPLRLRRRVPHDDIERRQDGAGKYQQRGENDAGFDHIPLMREPVYGMIRNRTHSACQLPKCKPAILIFPAT